METMMTKKILSILTSLALVFSGVLLATPAKAQQTSGSLGQQGSQVCRLNGTYYSLCYGQWSATVLTGTTATGSATLSMLYGYVTLPDGRAFVPFSTAVPIRVDVGANAETVTPSSVSGCFPLNPNQGVCQVTATFANVHGNGTQVFSGDQGIEEAILDAGNNGGGSVFWIVDTGIVTLNTGGLTTTTTSQIPASYYQIGASARVTTTITTSANWSVGVSGATASLCASNATLTAGTTCTAVAPGLTGTSTSAPALTAVLFTMGTSNPGAGAIKARVWGYTAVSANS